MDCLAYASWAVLAVSKGASQIGGVSLGSRASRPQPVQLDRGSRKLAPFLNRTRFETLSDSRTGLWYNSSHISANWPALWDDKVNWESPMNEEKFDESVDATLSAIRHRRMVLPAILLLAGHRPLAFTFGQVLLILQPLAALLGTDGLDAWARILSHPGGPAALTDRLADHLVCAEPTPQMGHLAKRKEKDRLSTRAMKSET